MADRYPLHELLAWRPVPTQLPKDWMALYRGLGQQIKSSPHIYVLKVRYNAQRVGDLLRSWGLPWQVVMAGYLGDYDERQIRSTNLQDADKVLGHINEANTYAGHIEDENLPPLLTPPYRDIGGLLIAVAIYFQALQTLQQQSNDQSYRGEILPQIESVGNTLTHITSRLGMWSFKHVVEDLIEQLRNPRRFAEDKQEYQQILKQDEYMLEATRQLLMASYQEATQRNVTVLYTPCAVTGMKRRLQDAHTTVTSQKTHLTGFDIVTFNVLVNTVRECYEAFGILNQLGYIHDHVTELIANPKPNGCSHIAFGLILKPKGARAQNLPWLQTQSRICQIQIATHVMYAIGWYGCLYPDYYQLCMKNSSTKLAEPLLGEHFWNSREAKALLAIRENFTNTPAALDAKAPIVVYDRNRKPFALSKGATALDFAYAVDREIGAHAVEAFVNNRKATLYRTLEAGDIVEIRVTEEFQAHNDWLEKNYAITPLARNSIKESLDQHRRDRRGRALLLQELERYQYKPPPEELDNELYLLVKQHNLGTSQAYLAQLDEKGESPYTPEWASQVIIEQLAERNAHSLMDKGRSSWIPILDMPPTMTKKPFRKQRFCDFCHPSHPRDLKIMGLFRDRSSELTVHKESCPHLIDHTVGHGTALLPMTWHLHYPAFRVTFIIMARDRKNLIFDITKQLRRHLCNFTAIHGEAIQGEARVRCTIDTDTDTEALDIWEELYQIESVTKVEIDAANTPTNTRNHLQKLRDERKYILPEEASLELLWAELLPVPPPRNAILKNPFDISRPATARMFFGRSQETKTMQRELCEGEQGKALILYGPRRAGKSSICRNFLDRQISPPFWGVFFSLQNSTRKTEDLILAEMTEEICTQFIEQLGHPGSDWPHFNDSDPLIRFRRVLQDCIARVPDSRLILALDEFGGALEAYERHILDHSFFTYWKELMDDIPQLSLIFALPTSSHNLLTREFSHAFSFAETLPVSFLDAESAEQLLVDPLRDQHIMIRPHTVTFATKLTGSNPYYMTLIGQRIMRHLNREKEKQLVTDDDLRLVIDQLIEEGSYQHFDFLRSELQCQDEFRILQAIVELSSRASKVQLRKIADWLNLPGYIVKQHLDRLRVGLILEEIGPATNPYYSFRIELVRRWLSRNRWFFTSTIE